MKETIIDDLNHTQADLKDCMQEVHYYEMALDEKVIEQTYESFFFARTFMKSSIINLHKISSAAEDRSLLSIWYKIEMDCYAEQDITASHLRKWRKILMPWQDDFRIIRNIRNKYVAHTDRDLESCNCSIGVDRVKAILILLEQIVVEMLNLTLKTSFTHIETVYHKRKGSLLGAFLLSGSNDTEIKRIPVHGDRDLDSRFGIYAFG
ncbi:hypothetical protein GFS24_25300 [Chitinophaga sp. SYP-B3965]|uniref:hypothetical protein n=1 Tax=Chitinophaga sp. SYP-B3965 TaxID=2663120 RepID=UPI001299EC07|nr:hypothetical protein [Chitinophaga sp. SYP-B3965]MRG48457.1 hypothetical protein [Chitinophaga sp. SYP-B3965]